MENKAHQGFQSDCGKAKVFVESDMPIGSFHDFLMLLKGIMVDRMVNAHKEQEEFAKSQKELEDEQPEEQ
jgi:hypothetical protein